MAKKSKKNFRKRSRRKTSYELIEFAYTLGLVNRGIKNSEGSRVKDAFERGMTPREKTKKKTLL